MPAIVGGDPIRKDFLVFGAPALGEEEIQEVVATLRSGWIGSGPKVARFEEQFAQYQGSPHAIAVNSCTAALHLSLLSLGIGAGDEVITTPMTFCATANAILHAGATPVFADCNRKTMNLDPEAVRQAITPRTRAILPVHFAGRPCDMPALMDIAEEHNLRVVEDCAHAIESRIGNQAVGTFGDLGCFSFYVTKNVVTAEGGMVLTSDPAHETMVKTTALHGMTKDAWKRFDDAGYQHYEVTHAGFKYNMTDLQASLGIHQLKRVDENLKKRNELWQRYDRGLQGLPCFLPEPAAPGTVHARHLYTLLLDLEQLSVDRDFILSALIQEGIGTGVHYLALTRHRFYQQFAPKVSFPEAEFISDRTLSLPLGPGMSTDDVDDVIAAVKRLLFFYAA
jgi:dTDP-4-amino-4,6-dideoxygalactose transaminase